MLIKIAIIYFAQIGRRDKLFIIIMITNHFIPQQYNSKNNGTASRNSNQILQSIKIDNIDRFSNQKSYKESGLLKQISSSKMKIHKRKYRQDAKFSSDSEQQPLPIKNDYLSMVGNKRQKSILIAKGSVLKLKACNLVVHTNEGRVDLQVEVLTQQSHKTIQNQLFDPGFQKISIKKDKQQQQIINYLQQSTKSYKYLVCWFQTIDPSKNSKLREISLEAIERKRILGWQNEHIKLHIMSMRQLKQIKRFKCPSRAASKLAASCFSQERLIMIVQYPQKIQQIRSLYHPFLAISPAPQDYFADVPLCEGETVFDRIAQKDIIFQKPIYHEVAFQGWHNQQNSIQLTAIVQKDQLNLKQNEFQIQRPVLTATTSSSSKEKINQIRLHFGFSQFEEILTDQEQKEQETKDLATQLLNSITSMPNLNFAGFINQQPFQGYYGNYKTNEQIMYPQGENYWARYPAQYERPASYGQPNYPNHNHINQVPFNHYPTYSSTKQTFGAPSLPYDTQTTKYSKRNNYGSFTR